MRLHSHVRVQMVERPIRLFASIPPTLIHALNFFVSPSRTLVLLCAWNWDKRIHGRKRVTTLPDKISHCIRETRFSHLQLAVSALYAREYLVLHHPMSQASDHMPSAVGTDPPSLAFRTPWAAQGTAASRAEAGTASIGAEEGR